MCTRTRRKKRPAISLSQRVTQHFQFIRDLQRVRDVQTRGERRRLTREQHELRILSQQPEDAAYSNEKKAGAAESSDGTNARHFRSEPTLRFTV